MTESGPITDREFKTAVALFVLFVFVAGIAVGSIASNYSGSGLLGERDPCANVDGVHVQSDGDVLVTFTGEEYTDVEVLYRTESGQTNVQVVEVDDAVSVEVEANAAYNSSVSLRIYDNSQWGSCGEYR